MILSHIGNDRNKATCGLSMRKRFFLFLHLILNFCVSLSIKVLDPGAAMHLLGFKVMLNPCNKLCPKLGDDTLEVIALCNLSETWR